MTAMLYECRKTFHGIDAIQSEHHLHRVPSIPMPTQPVSSISYLFSLSLAYVMEYGFVSRMNFQSHANEMNTMYQYRFEFIHFASISWTMRHLTLIDIIGVVVEVGVCMYLFVCHMLAELQQCSNSPSYVGICRQCTRVAQRKIQSPHYYLITFKSMALRPLHLT